MPFPFIYAVDCIALALFLFFFIAVRNGGRQRGLPYPPGPPSNPIIGNLLDVPKEAPWITYADMSRKYGTGNLLVKLSLTFLLNFHRQGDVIYLRVLNQVVVVLCSLSAIKDLLEKRGEAYADRPTLPITEMCVPSDSCPLIVKDDDTEVYRTKLDWLLPNTRKGEVWREGRKLLDRSLRPGATVTYRQMIREKTRGLLAQLLVNPNEFRSHIALSVVNLPLLYDVNDYKAFRQRLSCLLHMDTT
jgi:cytochrome P450